MFQIAQPQNVMNEKTTKNFSFIFVYTPFSFIISYCKNNNFVSFILYFFDSVGGRDCNEELPEKAKSK